MSISKHATQHKQAFDEPLWWGLFSAGGICFAVFLPAVILFIAVLLPLGLLPAEALSYERASTLLFSVPGFLFVGAVVCLPLFHAAHRLRHGMFDISVGNDALNKKLMYGGAALLSIVALGIVVTGFLR
ncbi:fumarate reductase subunit FrdD [Vreelandella boliviensis]|uniref:Fumarate reductase subunit D n=1 Tax=Vreelandella boliviensis LC1 TaxID=1072583 RepID=A0A265E1J6_9GAMM|nr:fumarate reductase subunit FrdD [Halomonas boliviensis]EHJ94727.1 Fumarate reductase subunit D [Halomonas boliviensis LC1]OZT75439.1 fumarate reductase subunit D [Halomonas boliviensis LC1]